MRKLSVIIVALVLAACSSSTAPSNVAPAIDLSSAIPSPANPQQVKWWTDLETCSGITRDWKEPTYYVLIGKSEIVVNGKSYWGYWTKDGNKIILAEAHASSTKLIEHEMMHALLQDGSHPAQYFNGVCGDLSYANETTN